MFFEGNWYACDPREPDDKKVTPEHLWPGLKRNTSKTNREAKEKFPYLPCCYTQDQYTKKSSALRVYLQEQMGAKVVETPKKDTGFGYVVGPQNRADPGRYGRVPFYWEKLLAMLDYQKIQRTKQEFYPLLRYGVPTSPDSFLWCLERAFNPKMTLKSMAEQQVRIAGIRQNWASQPWPVASREWARMGTLPHEIWRTLRAT